MNAQAQTIVDEPTKQQPVIERIHAGGKGGWGKTGFRIYYPLSGIFAAAAETTADTTEGKDAAE